MSRSTRIHLSVPHMSGEEQHYVRQAFDSNWLSSVGPNLDFFEEEVSALLGGRGTLAVSSGTAALHLVLRALGIGPGDRVAVSTLTFAGSVFPIIYVGATPVFLDSETKSWNLDPDLVREYLATAARVDKLPRALIVVHLYGQHANLDPLIDACREYDVMVVEDAAESLGATYGGRQTGTSADYAILSFNGNKIITTTGGGMVVSSNDEALKRMRKWASQSREPTREYLHTELGYNYRLSNLLAGVGRGQLRVLSQRVSERRFVFRRYVEAFEGLPLLPQPEAPWGTHSRWLSVFTLSEGEECTSVDGLLDSLGSIGIEARPVWRPMHTQPVFSDAPRFGGAVAERLFCTGVCLPSSSSLLPSEQDLVIEAVAHYLSE